MKRLLFILLCLTVAGFIGCQKAEAREQVDPCDSFLAGILNECVETHEKTLDHYEKYDYGLFLDILYAINDKVDVGVKSTWEVQRDEYTALLGAVIKFGPKKEE